jgi:hypothetical protein
MTTDLIETFRQTVGMFVLLLSLIMVYCMQKLLMIEMTNNNNKDNRYSTRNGHKLRSDFIYHNIANLIQNGADLEYM